MMMMMMMIRNRYHKNHCHYSFSFLHWFLLLLLLVVQPYKRMIIMINAIPIGQMDYQMEEQPYELQQLLFKVQQQQSSSSLSHHSAEIWMEIALWHEQQFQQLYATQQLEVEQEESLQQHLSYAIHALQQVIANYESDSTTATTTKQQQAAAYYQLGEMYYLKWQLISSTSTTNTFSTSSLNNMLSSMEDAWNKSKHMYYNLLEQQQQQQQQQQQSKEDEHPLTHDPWLSIEYALVCIRQGVYQVETIGLTTTSSSSTSTTNTNTEVQAMFTRIQVGWDLLQTGLHYLEPAMKQFKQQQQEGGLVVGSEEIEMLQQQRLTAWYNSATAATLLGQFDQALQALQPVLEYYSSMLSNHHHSSSFSSSSSSSFVPLQQQQYYIYGEALKTQADLYLQLGQYELTKQAYQKAMDFFITIQDDENEKDEEHHYQQQRQQQQELLLDNDEWQESIQMYQNALEEYQQYAVDTLDSSPLSSSSSSASTSNLHTLYERNDGYEGDLQATLGALYLTMGEMVLAEMHLRQAILLYRRVNQRQKHHDEADNRRLMADVHFNLAQLLFQQGEYSESAEQRRLACDLYHETLGEGINPMLRPEDEIPEELMSMESHFTPTKLSTTNQQTEVISAERIIPMDEDQISQWKDNHTSTLGDEL